MNNLNKRESIKLLQQEVEVLEVSAEEEEGQHLLEDRVLEAQCQHYQETKLMIWPDTTLNCLK